MKLYTATQIIRKLTNQPETKKIQMHFVILGKWIKLLNSNIKLR